MGDFNSLAEVSSDGMGLINGVVSEERGGALGEEAGR